MTGLPPDAHRAAGSDVQHAGAVGVPVGPESGSDGESERLVARAIAWVPELDPDGPRITDYLLRSYDDLRLLIRIAEDLFEIPNGSMRSETRPMRVRQVRQVVLYLMRRWSVFTHEECGLYVEQYNATEHSSYCFQRVRRRLAEGDLVTTWMVSSLAAVARRHLKGDG